MILGEVEKIRGPLTLLLNRIEAAGKQHETPAWRQLQYCLLDALERLDVAQEIAETAHLHDWVKKAAELREADGLQRLRPQAGRVEEDYGEDEFELAVIDALALIEPLEEEDDYCTG